MRNKSRSCTHIILEFRIFDSHAEDIEISVVTSGDVFLAYMDKCYGGFLFDEMFEYEEAIQACKETLDQDPDNHIAYNNRGIMQWEIGATNQAKADLESACKVAKTDAQPHKNLGLFLESQGDIDDALTAYREAVRRDRKDPTIVRCLGYLLINQRRFKEAIEPLSAAINLDRNFAYTYIQRAKAYDALGMPAEAREDREKAAALDVR